MPPEQALPATSAAPQGWLLRMAAALVVLQPVLMVASNGVSDAAMSLTGLLFLTHSFRMRDWAWARAPWFICLLLLWGYIMLRGLFAEEPYQALRRALPFIRYPLFAAALGYWVLRDSWVRERFMRMLLLVLALVAADSVVQFLRGTDIFGIPYEIDAQGHTRLTGPFGYKRMIVGVMTAWLFLPAALYLLTLREGRPELRSLGLAAGAALLFLAIILISGERMALLLALAGGLLAFLLLPLPRLMLLGAFGLAALLAGGLMMLQPDLFERQIASTAHILSHWRSSHYGEILTSGLKVAEVNPVFGVGANHFRLICPRVHAGATEKELLVLCNIHPHNHFIEWLTEGGIIGLALYAAFIGCIVHACIRAGLLRGAQPLFIGWAAAFAMRAWPIASMTGFFSRWGAPPYWLVLGALLAYTLKPEGKARHAGAALPVENAGV